MNGFSLRTKVFFLFAGAALLTVVPALVLIARAVEERVYERATQELTGYSASLRKHWQDHDELLQASARAVALEPGIAELFLSGDTVTLRKELTRRVGGREVVAADSTGAALVGPVLDTATLAAGGESVLLPPGGTSPLRVAVWPVLADRPREEGADSAGALAEDSVAVLRVGMVGVGSRLDAAAMRDLQQRTGAAHVALVVGDSLLATTLGDSLAQVLKRSELRAAVERGSVRNGVAENFPYLYRAVRLPTREVPSAILLFTGVEQELPIVLGISRSVWGIGGFALVLALLLALIVARIVSRPAQALAAAAAELAHGQYGAPLPRPSGDEIGQLTRAFAEMRSAIAQREARLRSAQAELIHREKLAAMGRLVAQLSHEINNPIYNIQNCLEVLDRRGDPNDPNREFLTLAREELGRMAVLTRQLLDQSRPLSDAATTLDLNQLVQRVVGFAARNLEAHDIRVELELEPGIPVVVAHPDAMQQVLANLVDNAVDAMPAGGTLRVGTRADADVVEVTVQDTGVGITDEHLPHIFEAFYTTKPGVRGIGLGLFVSEGIVRGHRGRLSVESRAGEGSRFVIRLPRETLDPTFSGAEAPEPDASATV